MTSHLSILLLMMFGLFPVWGYCKESFYKQFYAYLLVNLYNIIFRGRVGKYLVLKKLPTIFKVSIITHENFVIPHLCQHLALVSSFHFSFSGWESNGISFHFILQFSDCWCWVPFLRFLAIYVKNVFKFFANFFKISLWGFFFSIHLIFAILSLEEKYLNLI